MAEEKVRRGLLLKTAMEILRDDGAKVQPAKVLEEIRRRVALTSRELSLDDSGLPRYDRAVGFETARAATVGWASKIGGWSITDAGIEALDTSPDPNDLQAELARLYRGIDQRREQALQSLGEVDQFIAKALQLVEPGTWTAHDDLAQLADTSPEQVADFLAGTRVALPNSYRVLLADGAIPPKEFLPGAYRGTDLRQRLAAEGTTFDASGRASREQRITADVLKVQLAELAEDTDVGSPNLAQRAWMVRGTNIDGYNLVPDWLSGGFVSLSASQLGQLDAGISFDALKQAVETAYQHKSYAYRGQRLEELDRFIRRMRVGDLVLTPMQGSVYLGEITSGPRFGDDGMLAGFRRAGDLAPPWAPG